MPKNRVDFGGNLWEVGKNLEIFTSAYEMRTTSWQPGKQNKLIHAILSKN